MSSMDFYNDEEGIKEADIGGNLYGIVDTTFGILPTFAWVCLPTVICPQCQDF